MPKPGLLFGALRGKEAWGPYWTWDPKETWAFLIWIGYLACIHYRHHRPADTLPAMIRPDRYSVFLNRVVCN